MIIGKTPGTNQLFSNEERILLAYSVALLTNFVGLILSIWLGVYIITHSRRSTVTLLSGLTLWVLADIFAHILLGIFSSPAPASQPLWLRLIFPIWPLETYKTGIAGWTQGWAVCLAIIFWYHTTTLIVPGKMTRWRLASLLAVYGLGITAMLLQAFTPYLFTVKRTDPYFVDTLRFGLLYPFFAFFLILFSGLSVFNLVQAAQQSHSTMLKKQMTILIVATLAATVATIIYLIGSMLGSPVPAILVSFPLLVAVCFFGYGVARYSALMEHRVLRRDFIYNGIATGLVVLIYLGIFLWLNKTYDIPDGVVVFLIPLVIISHSMIEEVRLVLDRLIYDRRTRDLRANLRRLSRLAGEQAGFGEMLTRTLEAICEPVRATFGVVLVIEKNALRVAGSYHWHGSGIHLSPQEFQVEGACQLNPGSLPEPFIEATLLVPLYGSEDQIGALVLGRPENGIHYSRDDVQFLMDPCDRIAELIIQTRRIDNYLNQIAQMPIQTTNTNAELIPTQWVEDALQNFYDFAYLGDSPLVNLKQVRSNLPDSPVTHLDRGKAVYQVVSEALEKLRPGSTLPEEPVPREWFPYLILHHAYLDGLSNREIMLQLYISEGTFNRTRRSALRCLARVLTEIEAHMN